jgi:nicotinate-nucleotide pyrophosphorylase (carboxylating)
MLDPAVQDLITKALAEDVGLRDITTEAIVEPGTRSRARIEQREPGVLYGLDVAQSVFRRLDALIEWRPLAPEGAWRKEAPATVVELSGDARAILTGERVALNFLQHLSGVATLTARCVDVLRGTGIQVLDTRKTTPGLRLLEKRAVVAGGGGNHRASLYDGVLVKENHIALAGGVEEATRRALARRPAGMPVQVECRTIAEVEEALAAGAERLLLDNMEPAMLRRAVDVVAGRVPLEASGGVRPESLPGATVPGLQWISLGSLTHSAPALDLSLELEHA